MASGYVFLYRELLEKPIWINSTPEQCKILITLLLMANHAIKEWEWRGGKYKLCPGQFITSLESIMNKCGSGVTIQNIRTALKRFEKLEFLTNESTKSGRLITILNWRLYQVELLSANKADNKDLTNDQQRPNSQLTPNKNDKNNKNDKDNINNVALDGAGDNIPPAENDTKSGAQREGNKPAGKGDEYSEDFKSFWGCYPRQKDQSKAWRCWKTRLKENHSPADMIKAARAYAAECKGKDEQFIKLAATFLGRDRPFREYVNQEAEKYGKPIFETAEKSEVKSNNYSEYDR